MDSPQVVALDLYEVLLNVPERRVGADEQTLFMDRFTSQRD